MRVLHLKEFTEEGVKAVRDELEYAFWTSWNDGRMVLNGGHYGIPGYRLALWYLREYVDYHPINYPIIGSPWDIARCISEAFDYTQVLLEGEELCKLAGMEDEWRMADGDKFEEVLHKAADKLGVFYV